MLNASLKNVAQLPTVSASASACGSDMVLFYLLTNEESRPGLGQQVGSHSTGTNLHGGLLHGDTEASKRSVWKLKGARLILGE